MQLLSIVFSDSYKVRIHSLILQEKSFGFQQTVLSKLSMNDEKESLNSNNCHCNSLRKFCTILNLCVACKSSGNKIITDANIDDMIP